MNVCQCGVDLHFNEYTDECVTINGCHPAQVLTQAYGCLDKVPLGLPCKDSHQCRSLNSHSYCSHNLGLNRHICDCEVGFSAEPDSGESYACFEVDENLGEDELKRTTPERDQMSHQQLTRAPKIKAEEEERLAILKERNEELKAKEILRKRDKGTFLGTLSSGWIIGLAVVGAGLLFFIGFMVARYWTAGRVKASQRQEEYSSIEGMTAQTVV